MAGLPEVTAKLNADVSGFIRGWEQAADAATAAAARIKAAQEAIKNVDLDSGKFKAFAADLKEAGTAASDAAKQMDKIKSSSKGASSDVEKLGRDAKATAEDLGGASARGGAFATEVEKAGTSARKTSEHVGKLGSDAKKAGSEAEKAGEGAKKFGSSLKTAFDALGSLGQKAADAAGAVGGKLLGSLTKATNGSEALAVGIMLLVASLPGLAAAATALTAGLLGLGVAGLIVKAGWKGIADATGFLEGRLASLKSALDNIFRQGLIEEFSKLGTAMNQLGEPIKGIARAVVEVVKEFTGWIRSAQGMSEMRTTLEGVENMIQQLAPGAKALAQAFTAFGAAAAPAMGKIGEALSSIFEKLNKVFQKAKDSGDLTKAFQAGADAVSGLGDVLAGLLDILIKVAADGGEPAADAFKKFGQSLDDLAPLIGLLFHGLATVLDMLMTIVSWCAKFAKALEPLYDIFNKVMDGVDGFLKKLGEIPVVGKSAGEAFENIKKAVGMAADALVKSTKDWWDKTVQNVKDGTAKVIQSVKDWMTKTKQDIKDGIDSAVQSVKDWWSKTKQDVKDGVANVIQAVKDWFSKTKQDIKDGADKIVQDVKDWWNQLVQDVKDGVDKAIDEIKKLPDRAKDALEQWKNDMKEAGKDAGKGLDDGLKEATDNVVQTAKAIAKAAMDAIKQELGIKSPSVVFREEVGKMIPAGIAEGIIGNAGAVTDAMHRVGLSSVAAGRGGISTALGGGAGGGLQLQLKVSGGADSAMGTAIAKLARTGQLKITANSVLTRSS